MDNVGTVDKPPTPLTPRQLRHLIELVEQRAPDLLPLAEASVNQRWLTDEEAEALAGVALSEFVDHLGPSDEPDRQGVEADDLMGVIEMQRRGFWR